MKLTSIHFIPTVLALALTSIASATPPAAQQQQTRPNDNVNATTKTPLADDPMVELAEDLRQRELTSRHPDVTAIRLDQGGDPLARMDLHFGGAVPQDEALLREIVDQFEFADSDVIDKGEDSHWRTLFFVDRNLPRAAPDLVFFDPQADLAIGMSRITSQYALTCAGYFAVNYNATKSTGSSVSFYPSNTSYLVSDMIAAAVGPDVNKSTDPDLYLYSWNGSSWSLVTSATSATHVDAVSAWQTSCLSVSWRVKVLMYYGGAFGLRVFTFRAG